MYSQSLFADHTIWVLCKPHTAPAEHAGRKGMRSAVPGVGKRRAGALSAFASPVYMPTDPPRRNWRLAGFLAASPCPMWLSRMQIPPGIGFGRGRCRRRGPRARGARECGKNIPEIPGPRPSSADGLLCRRRTPGTTRCGPALLLLGGTAGSDAPLEIPRLCTAGRPTLIVQVGTAYLRR